MENQLARCKIVVIGDSQCGKTALLHVFAKDAYPEVESRGKGEECRQPGMEKLQGSLKESKGSGRRAFRKDGAGGLPSKGPRCGGHIVD